MSTSLRSVAAKGPTNDGHDDESVFEVLAVGDACDRSRWESLWRAHDQASADRGHESI